VEVLERAVGEPPEEDRDTHQALEAELIGIALREPDLYEWAGERLAQVSHEQAPEGYGGRALLCLQAAYDSHLGRERAACVERVEQALSDATLFEQAGDWVCWVAADVLHVADELERARQIGDEVRERARITGAVFLYAAASGFRAVVSLAGPAGGSRSRCSRSARGVAAARPRLPALPGELAHPDAGRARRSRGRRPRPRTLIRPGPARPDRRGRLALRSRPPAHRPRPNAPGTVGLARLRRSTRRVGCRNPAICQWRSRAALAHARLGGDREEAAPLAAEAVELARAWGAPRPLGAALRAQALVHDADIEILRESVNILDNSPGRLELARARRPRGGAAPGGTPRRGARAAAPGRGARRRLRHLTVSGPLGIVVRAWEPGGVGMAVCPLSLDDLGGVAAGVVGCPGPLIGTCSR
jgi:hypothetical protein